MTTYAVGDIQGCYKPLKCLLKQVEFDPAKDKLLCVGDLVNRGPKSLKTLRFLKSLGDSVQVVLGNHDLHLLACAITGSEPRKSDTFDKILNADDKDELIEWLSNQPLIHSEGDYVIVHAGIAPMWSYDQALALGKEVQDCLQSKKATKYYKKMYGNTPECWNDDLTGMKRLRVITNYFTRMRYCKADGSLNLSAKMAPSDCYNAEFTPWYFMLDKSWKNKKIIFGHWASLMGECPITNVFALDTGCVWGNKMTMLNLDNETLIQCDCKS